MSTNTSHDAWYRIENINAIDSPSLIVYKQRIQQNIQRAIAMVNDVQQLRPHVKTNKMAEVCSMMMSAGITKFKCATIAEAEMLGMLAAKDVLLAYQPVGPKMQRLVKLIKAYAATRFSCLVDNVEIAEELAAVAKQNAVDIDVFIDVNVGMNRTGIQPTEVVALYKKIIALPHLQVKGLHAYDGHIRDTDVAIRKEKCDAVFETVKHLKNLLTAEVSEKAKELIIVIGGSPSFPVHAKREGVECTPGTFVFWDWGYKHTMPDEPFEYAGLVITRVISIIDEQTLCTDLGHKSVAAENPLPRVHFLNAAEAVPVGQSEEHLVLKVSDTKAYKTGDVLYGVPVHICPTVALYDTAIVIENNKATDEWKVIARDRKISV